MFIVNHMEHTNTLCGQNAETLYIRIQSVPHRKHYVSATETNRLMLFGETVAVYCENHMEHTDVYKLNPYFTGNITSPLQSPTG
jgi:hypothetical protein